MLLTGPITHAATASLREQLALAEDARDYDASAELARRILITSPRDPAAWESLARAQIKTDDYTRALATLSSWEKISKKNPLIDDLRGDIHLAQDHREKAEQSWKASLAIQANNYRVLSKLADLLEDQERWSEVLALRTRAAAAMPTAALLAAKAGALLHLHQWDAAGAAIQRANKLDPTDATVQQWFPKLELLAKALPRIKPLDAQIAAHPKDREPLLDEAVIFIEIEQPSLALSNARRAMALAPGSIRARIQAGDALLHLSRIAAAAKLKVSHDLKRDPNDNRLTPESIHDLDAADIAIEANPGKPAPLAARSKVLRNLNQFVLALDDAKAALALDANSPEAEFEMGHDLDGLGKPGEALPHIIRATDLKPNDPVAWYYRGIIEANRADFHAAIASQTRSIAIRESAVAYAARADCESRLWQNDKAATDNTRAGQLR